MDILHSSTTFQMLHRLAEKASSNYREWSLIDFPAFFVYECLQYCDSSKHEMLKKKEGLNK